jgi:hypothetical protein
MTFEIIIYYQNQEKIAPLPLELSQLPDFGRHKKWNDF